MASRLAAFALLVCAAFAWTPPYLDRPGTAALGLAFAALTLGRVAVAARPSTIIPRKPAIYEPEKMEPVPSDLQRALALYGIRGGRDSADA